MGGWLCFGLEAGFSLAWQVRPSHFWEKDVVTSLRLRLVVPVTQLNFPQTPLTLFWGSNFCGSKAGKQTFLARHISLFESLEGEGGGVWGEF